MTTEFSQNDKISFYCEKCDYTTKRKIDFTKHLLTAKHKKVTNTTEKSLTPFLHQCSCGKSYPYRASLFNHKKKCNFSETQMKSHISEDLIMQLVKENQDIKNILFDQNKTIHQQQKTINDLVPKIGNNNCVNSHNTNNIIVMLNEKCKDALNINEFIESLTITLEDLNITKDKGLVQGITNAFVKNLRKLDVDKRPLHCSDVKRDVLYIKDNEIWEKDKENEKIKESINKVAHEHRRAINTWTDANPTYMTEPHKQNEYIQLVKNATESLHENREESKVIKNICKETQLNKDEI